MDGCDWWCVGSTSGKKPVHPEDLSVIPFYGSSLAGVNARSENLSGCREVTDFKGCPECGQLN